MRKTVLAILLLILLLGGSFVLARYLHKRSEGKWICINGEWVKQGNPFFSKPSENCRFGIVENAKRKLEDESLCLSVNGKAMNYLQAKELAQKFCKQGSLKDEHMCNSNSGTWWIDFTPDNPKGGCNPACVVDVEKSTADINWRCTGLNPK